jgi:hypothetical protein
MANQHNEWTATELDLMRQVYPSGGAKATARVLPGRTLQTITKRAQLMNIKRLSAAGVPRRPRTKPEREETYRLPHEPLSELNRVALREWGRFTAARGPEQLTPIIEVRYDEAA